jgi:hypothetical protein
MLSTLTTMNGMAGLSCITSPPYKVQIYMYLNTFSPLSLLLHKLLLSALDA